MTTHRRNLNAEIRAAMARKGITGSDIANVLQLSQGAVSRRLTGQTDWSVSELAAVAEHLGVSASSLLMAAEVAS